MKFLLIILLCFSASVYSQSVEYPYPVRYLSLNIEQQKVKMAYMDVQSSHPNGKSVLLLHGKNFNGYYWKDVIAFLIEDGYRVIVPDQVGWGFSDKPNIHYSFHLLANNTKQLLDSLGIKKLNVIGHSMGGMLAARFSLMFPAVVDKLIFENPIGLEDYKTFVPYHSLDSQYNSELKANYESLKKYQQGYYPEWRPEYEQYVAAQYQAMQIPDFKTATWASALTYQMIYQQPVVYELKNIKKPVLIIIGQADRTIVGKNLLSKQQTQLHGNYPELGRKLKNQIANSKLAEFPGVGHIPHIQETGKFKETVLDFLRDRTN
ncbi:MAG: alpha/beta fold hydrolase [Flavisolibacter sp.]